VRYVRNHYKYCVAYNLIKSRRRRYRNLGWIAAWRVITCSSAAEARAAWERHG
jgi:hypothetical protein